jgi:clathrin heavy chain
VLSVSVNESTIVPFIMNQLQKPEVAFKIASRGNLPGADDLFVTRFEQLMQQQNFAEAARVAAGSPNVFALECIWGYANVSKGHIEDPANYG